MAKKTALITGCSTGGIGHALAESLAAKGYRVLATVRSAAKASDLQDAAKKNGWDVQILELDVRDQKSVDAALADAGEVDVLVNNAGYEVWGPLEEVTIDDLKDQFETNVYGPMRMIHGLAPQMRNRGSGIVVNLSSVAGVVAAPLNGAYAASKFALEALTESLKFELGHWGIRFHLVEPGRIDTPFRGNRTMVGAAAGKESPYAELITIWDTVDSALGTRAKAEDVAAVVVEAIETGDKFRYPVGQDATMILTARKAMTFEQFEQAMRTQLQLTW